MGMKRLLYFLRNILFLFAVLFTFAGCNLLDGNSKTGNYTVKGKVVNRLGEAVYGVDVCASGTSSNTTTNSSGEYTLEGIGRGTIEISAKKSGYTLIPEFKNENTSANGFYLNVGSNAENGTVYNADFIAVEEGSLTIAEVQGTGAVSPLVGKYVTVTGVVTMISNMAPHWNYDNSNLAGDDVAQLVGTDGIFIEALPEDKDFSGLRSNGIFIDTHDYSYGSESKWKDGIPTDLQAGDVITVSGIVEEQRTLDRYGSSAGSLTRTQINADFVANVTVNGVNKTSPYPAGVLITYSQSKADAWKNTTYTVDGKTYNKEARVMCYDLDTSAPMQTAIDILETMESMVIRIEDPLVVGATYYNQTSVLADGGKDADGNYFRTFNEKWMGNVIQQNSATGYQDFNEEVLFVDYQPVDWKAYASSIPQIGDTLTDSNGEKVFRGVLDYTCDGIYMAHPLNNLQKMYLTSSEGNLNKTPCYTRTDTAVIKDVTGSTVPNQLWNFSNDSQWFQSLDTGSFGTVTKTNVIKYMKEQGNSSSPNYATIKAWRTGTSASSSFNAGSVFMPKWTEKSSTSKGNKEEDSLTVAVFNLENYEAQGGSYSKDADVALVMKNNLLYPDVLCVVEMGDDVETSQMYENQDNAYVIKDGYVTAVRNFSGIIDDIRANGGPAYDFRCIDPKEGDSGGKGGVNIRVGFLYNTERVVAVDSGLVTNNYANTHKKDSSGNTLYGSENLLDESQWPVQTFADNIQGWTLADAVTAAYKGEDGRAHISQSPCYVHSSYFNYSRRPLICEFKIKREDGTVSDENFFVIACHLGSKRGDYPLYGSVQPPLLLSEVKRNGQAQAVNDMVKSILHADENARIVVAGDMNDFGYSTPAKVLTGEQGGNQILYSLTEEFMPVNERFSYAFEGNLQQIDHIYVSPALFEKAETAKNANGLGCGAGDEWQNVCFIAHIDSMFTRNNHYNLSDHDADIIRIPGAFNFE